MTGARRHIFLLAFVVGLATLGTEIAAARLLAPWFGASTIVWANTIATVLVALSVGYWLGGRLADRDPTIGGLSRVVLAGGALVAAVPYVAGPFLEISVDALDRVEAGAAAGSLLAVLVLLAAPVLVLGCVAPWALRLTLTELDETGRTAGRLSAISTLGSLVGTFASALLLIPFLGTRRTFLVFALALCVVAVPGLARRWLGVVGAVLCVVLLALPTGVVKADGGRVLWEDETPYQYARVIEASDGQRTLELNEGQAVHSVLRPSGSPLTGDYWDEPLVLPAATLGREPRNVAILGGAAGTVARAFGMLMPETTVDSVEIDGELHDVGKRFFDLRGRRLRLHTADARPWLRRTGDRFELIYVDTYRQPYIPFYLATREFFELARDRLAPGGVVIVNVGHPESSDEIERALSATMGDVFAHVVRDPAQPTNTQLMATNGPRPEPWRLAAADLPAPLKETARAAADRLQQPLSGGDVWTDDLAPVEWVIDSSILQVAANGER